MDQEEQQKQLQQTIDKWTTYDIDPDWFSEQSHVAAIVPLHIKTNYSAYPVPEFLQLVKQNVSAIEYTLYQAASMGVDSIWIVTKPSMYRFVRNRIPDFIVDNARNKENNIGKNSRRIPIMIVPEQERFVGVRDSPAWHLYYGAMTAYKCCNVLSKWQTPSKYIYLSPYAMMDEEEISSVEMRKAIRSHEQQIFVHNGKNYLDYELLPFTFRLEELKNVGTNIRTQMLLVSNSFSSKSSYEQYTREITIPNMFKQLDDFRRTNVEIKEYYSIESWLGYREYLNSDLSKKPTSLNIQRKRYFKHSPEPHWKFGNIFKEKEVRFNEFMDHLTTKIK